MQKKSLPVCVTAAPHLNIGLYSSFLIGSHYNNILSFAWPAGGLAWLYRRQKISIGTIGL